MKPRARKKQSGQSLLEFVACMLGFLTVFFMVVQVSLGFAVANFIQYATFMASRALLSSGRTPEEQGGAAEVVMSEMLTDRNGPKFQNIIRGVGAGTANVPGLVQPYPPSPRVTLAQPNSRDTSWEQGVSYKFTMKLYLLPIVRGAKTGRANQVELESQSFLGRDPSVKECNDQLSLRAAQSNAERFLVDNGC